MLRYGWLCGPGTSVALNPLGSQIELICKRQFPIVGGRLIDEFRLMIHPVVLGPVFVSSQRREP